MNNPLPRPKPYKVSYSAVKTFLDSPERYYYQYILFNFNKPTEAFMLGNIVDCLALEPEKFDTHYAVLDEDAKPGSGQERAFISDIIRYKIKDVEVDDEALLSIGQNHYKQGSKKDAAFVKELKVRVSKLENYVECAIRLLPERGKFKKEWEEKLDETLPYIISPITYHWAVGIVDSLKSYPLIYNLLWEGEGWAQKEIIRVPPYINEEDNTVVKVLLDRLRVNHKKKTIYIIDLKTTKTENGPSFEQAVKSYGYKIQMGMYGDIVKIWAEEQGYGDYKIKYLWVVAAKTKPYACFVVEAKEEHLEEARVLYTKTIRNMIECRRTNNWKQEKVWTLSE